MTSNVLYFTAQFQIKNKKTTYFSLCVPLNFGVVDKKADPWVKMKKANLLCISSVVPKKYRIVSELRVTILIKLNALV